MKLHFCDKCRFRAYAERKPHTLLAWLWRMHTHVCPGWKAYQRSLKREENTPRS